MSIWDEIETKISASLGQSFQLQKHRCLAGGSINQAYQIDGLVEGESENKAVRFFIKFNHKSRLDMFVAEAAGLQEIETAQVIGVPHVVCCGIAENQSYLVLENLALAGGVKDSAIRLGQKIASMHQNTTRQFGWLRNNTIGSTEQINTLTDNWVEFWRTHRLAFQFNLARENGCGQSLYIKGEKLMVELDNFFIDYEPQASLLHGDLWSGNYGYLTKGEPVIFDPAVYYGDRETDIAMTELFGGFPAEFYTAYNKVWPLDKGYEQRKTLYNLYHVLNHYNLFGGGYASQAENMLDKLLLNM